MTRERQAALALELAEALLASCKTPDWRRMCVEARPNPSEAAQRIGKAYRRWVVVVEDVVEGGGVIHGPTIIEVDLVEERAWFFESA